MVVPLLLFTGIFLLAYAGVAIFRKWSLKKGLLDSPNERSSHKTPTPRGGGIVIASLCLVSYSGFSFYYPETFSWGYLLGAVIVGLVSWLDDVYSLWFLWRLAAHTAAAAVLILGSGIESLGLLPLIISFCWVVWLINAYNFMDGIDGIAGLQAVIAGASWLIIGYIFDMPSIFYFGGVIAASSLGFLIHNWQPAKIFMGDVGSAFLGFTFAALSLLAKKQGSKPSSWLAIAAVSFLWFFIFDSVVTFFNRLFHGKNVFSAHREHIYQKLVLSGMSHSRVTVIYGVLATLLSISTVVSVLIFGDTAIIVCTTGILLTAILMFIYLTNRSSITK